MTDKQVKTAIFFLTKAAAVLVRMFGRSDSDVMDCKVRSNSQTQA